MNCHEIDPLLSALLDDELTVEERYIVQQHLQGCMICWRTLGAFQSFNAAALAVLPTRAVAPPAVRRYHGPAVRRLRAEALSRPEMPRPVVLPRSLLRPRQ